MAAEVEALLFGGADKVLREAPLNTSFDHAYAADCAGGRELLLRYASEDPVRKVPGRWLKPAGIAAAEAVWNSRDSQTKQFASLWNRAGDAAFN